MSISLKIYTLDEIRKIIAENVKDQPIDKVILFGSYAKGEANKYSDIDMIVQLTEGTPLLEYCALYPILEDAFNKYVDIFEVSELKDKSYLDGGIVIYDRTAEKNTAITSSRPNRRSGRSSPEPSLPTSSLRWDNKLL